jgi:hypothetical protein
LDEADQARSGNWQKILREYEHAPAPHRIQGTECTPFGFELFWITTARGEFHDRIGIEPQETLG